MVDLAWDMATVRRLPPMLLDQVVLSNHLSAPSCCVSAATCADMSRYLAAIGSQTNK